jgi:ubiquinone/menaquinone biosynthesis C-methylase UbiE
MPGYFSPHIDFNNPQHVAVMDELSLWSAAFGELLFAYLPLRPGLSVLDVGCGSGFPLLDLAQRLGKTSRTFGIDPWQAGLERAQQKAVIWQVYNAALLEGDAAAMPFAAGSFDLLVSNLGVNNFAQPAIVLQECWRVAKPGACLALTTNLPGHMRQFYIIYHQTLRQLGLSNRLAALDQHIAHRLTVEQLTTWLELAGFTPRRVKRRSFQWRFLDGSAFLWHSFIRLGFLDGMRSVLPPEEQEVVFNQLENNLNQYARKKGEFSLTIPMAYLEVEKSGI